MFLGLLEENVKKDFLNIAHYAISLNGERKEEEVEVFETFRYECGLPDYAAESKTENELIDSFTGIDEDERRVVVLELLGILLADGEVCQEEREFLSRLESRLRIGKEQLSRMERWVADMNQLVDAGFDLVKGGETC